MRSFRCSVLSMMETEGKNYFTHPMFLAPFIVVSEGGRRCDSRSNHRSAASRANVCSVMRWTAPTRRHLGAKMVVSMNHREIGAVHERSYHDRC